MMVLNRKPIADAPMDGTPTPEELAILRPEYHRWLLQHIVMPWDTTEPMTFDCWWRSMADNEMDKREGK